MSAATLNEGLFAKAKWQKQPFLVVSLKSSSQLFFLCSEPASPLNLFF